MGVGSVLIPAEANPGHGMWPGFFFECRVNSVGRKYQWIPAEWVDSVFRRVLKATT
jgi:hypothetical protein